MKKTVRFVLPLLALFVLLLSSCTGALLTDGEVLIDYQEINKYKHALISDKTPPFLRAQLEKVLLGKGYVVYRADMAKKLRREMPFYPIISVHVKDGGYQKNNESNTVYCIAYDFLSDGMIYKGVGEYEGWTKSHGIGGAMRESLKVLPDKDTEGRVAFSVEPGDGTDGSGKISVAEGNYAGNGTGWVVSSGYVVTNAHVVGHMKRVVLYTIDKKQITADVVHRDQSNDIALLRPVSTTGLGKGIPLATAPAVVGEDAFTIGYPKVATMGIEPKFTAGKINSLTGLGGDPRFYQTSAPIQPGNSGGPLLNQKGEAIGITTLKLNTLIKSDYSIDAPQNVNYAVKTAYLEALLKSAGPWTKHPTLKPEKASYAELVQRLKRSIVFVLIPKP